MADQFFRAKVDTSQASSVFGKLAARLQGTDPLLRSYAAILNNYEDGLFEAEQSPSGQPWAKLAPSTIAQRQRKGLTPLKKLQATGKGKSGIRAIVASGGRVQLTVREDYLQFNNDGTRRIPSRRFIPSQQEFEAGILGGQIKAATEAYITQGLGGFVKGEIARTSGFVRGLLS